jgi:Glycosyltransferase family 87
MISSWPRTYWLGGTSLAILLVVALVMNPWLSTEKQVDHRSMGLDFVAFYTAGTFVRERRGTDLYNLPALDGYQKKLAVANDLDLKCVAPWWNPPVFAWVFAPLSMLSIQGAYITWLAINSVCLAIAIRLLMNLFPAGISGQYRWLIALLIGVSMPTVQALGHAQNSPISLLLLIGSLILAKKNFPILAGAVIGLLAYKPQIAIAVAFILAISINWRVLIGFAVMGAALLAINVVTLPGTLEQMGLHLAENLHDIQFGQIYIWERQITFSGFWRLLLQGREPAERSTVVVILALISQAVLASGLFYSWRRSREHVEEGQTDSFLIVALTAMPLLLPYFLDYDLLLLAVPAVLYARRNIAAPVRLGTVMWTALYICLLVNPGVGRLTHMNLAVPFLCMTVGAMIVQFAEKKSAKEVQSELAEKFVRLAA